MDRRLTVRIPEGDFIKLKGMANNKGASLSDEVREAIRIYSNNEIHDLIIEIRKLRKDLDYLIDKDKRKEYAESRVM